MPAPQSIYTQISKLTPGTLLTVTLDHAKECIPVPYWSLLDVARKGQQAPFEGSDSEALAQLNSMLSAAVCLSRSLMYQLVHFYLVALIRR